MSPIFYYISCVVLAVGILIGISMMSKVRTSIMGNLLSALCTFFAIILTLTYYSIITDILLWVALVIGLAAGLLWAGRIKMIQMPQVVALLNGFGGAASALVAIVTILAGVSGLFSSFTAYLALLIGTLTLTGSLIAAGKLHKVLTQKPVILKGHQGIVMLTLVVMVACLILGCIGSVIPAYVLIIIGLLVSGFFGVILAIRVGGADMPITISLLNSFSGVAGAIAGMAIGDILLVAVGGIVGASGLLLTQIMCRAMNRRLSDILLSRVPKTSKSSSPSDNGTAAAPAASAAPAAAAKDSGDSLDSVIENAKDVIIVPGYGMALSQAQSQVKELCDALESRGKTVRFAIHPVAGRMPGHMNVLLAEVNVDYEKLFQMEEINSDFPNCDLAIVVGANDVINPAAGFAEGTPIYGMPVLDVAKAKYVIICNRSRNPGYAGVPNPLFEPQDGVTMFLGDAAKSVAALVERIKK